MKSWKFGKTSGIHILGTALIAICLVNMISQIFGCGKMNMVCGNFQEGFSIQTIEKVRSSNFISGSQFIFYFVEVLG